MTLTLRAIDECRYDAVALGEVMLRLDPGEGRVRTARSFRASEGGGEYNVARGLRRAFGQRTAVVTALGDNEVGLLLEDLILQGGVDTAYLVWKEADGIGRENRNALNFTERGFGVRGALGVSDRAHSATAALAPDDVDWDRLFGVDGVRWLHTGGIFAGLSAATAEVAEAAMTAARAHGTVVSYDLNYRPSIWREQGGQARAQEVNRRLVALVDVLFGNEEDFTSALGFEVDGVNDALTALDPSHFEAMIASVTAAFPQLEVVATTLREVHTASVNGWGAVAWSAAAGFARATNRRELAILDRVGGGDSFASGLAFGLLEGRSLLEAVELGAAHGALAMTTPGDTSMASRSEVESLAAGGSARVQR
ncbi:sugar kinase [Kineosporia sp. A_224]|uniref:sugar kinase n=1 Tax=Kineosporia sp. A_224 TaxID=1962180 RepID=UPI000B4C0440|nr:sugar kinase [Kineosporia sp. A_224]